jgi:hypothetical protein
MAVDSQHSQMVRADAALRPRKLAVYGSAIELQSEILDLEPIIAQILGPFTVSDCPAGFGVIRGFVRPYDEAEVIRRLPPAAVPLHRPGDLMELYSEGERFWMIDDRWGMCEINVLRAQWRAWVLPLAKLDAVRLAEMAVLWPLAQLLKNKGLHLVPAASAVRDEFAVLLLSPFGLEPELEAMLAAGYQLIGQRWTAIREEESRPALLHMPGMVQRKLPPQLRAASSEQWVDLASHSQGATQRHAFCRAVLVTEAGRRPRAHLRKMLPPDAGNLLRRTWPIAGLHPHRRYGQLPVGLARAVPCYQLQLSRDPKDLLSLLDSLGAATGSREVA